MQYLKNRLQSGESLMGTMILVFDNPDVVNMLQVCGFDYFVLDCEHGAFDLRQAADILGRAKSLGLPAVVRVPSAQREVILKYMDMGAAGLMLPNCDSVEKARALVQHAKYHPLGQRGVSVMRAHNGYERPVAGMADYMRGANKATLLMIQIESPAGVDNVADMLAVDGIDAAFVGPNDLSQSMGIMGQLDHPRFLDALDRVIAAAKGHNKYAGIHMTEAAALRTWMEKGMTLNMWSNDVAMLMSAGQQGLTQLRSYMA